jgi:hypothetical protein
VHLRVETTCDCTCDALTAEREVGGGDDGLAQWTDQGAELITSVLSEVKPWGHGEQIGPVLDRLMERAAFIGERSLVIDEASVTETRHGGVPILVAPGARGLKRRPTDVGRRGVQHQRLDGIDACADEADHVTVAAELT